MIEITRQKEEWLPQGLPKDSDCPILVYPGTVVRCQGYIACAVLSAEVPADLRAALMEIRFPSKPMMRTRGLPTRTRGFGFKSRNPLRGDFCSSAGMQSETPAAHSLIANFAQRMDAAYAKANPVLYDKHKAMVDSKYLPDWRLPNSVFTSGNANLNSAIGYHYDRGNLPGVWSAMIVARGNCEGGNLCLPEIGIRVDIGDGTIVLFDGQSYLHGVSPIRYRRRGYRISLVYFTYQQMWKCLPPSEELSRAKKVYTERQQGLIGRSVTEKAEARMRRDGVISTGEDDAR